MLRRKFRKMPKDMQDFSKRFGWSARDASKLLDSNYGMLSERAAAGSLKVLAGEYADWFRKEPQKTHLFPLKASIFQYWFARGVRDAIGSKARMRTIAGFRTPHVGRELQLQAAKLKLDKGIVFHDYAALGTTVENISRAADLYPEQYKLHQLEPGQDKAGGKLPVLGKKVFVKAGHLVGKKVDSLAKKMDFRPEIKGLSEKQVAFVKRAVYAAGVASARGLLKKEK